MWPAARIDPCHFPLADKLRSGFSVFLRELRALTDADFAPYYDASAYSGDWRILPLEFDVDPTPKEYDLHRNRQTCPESWSIVSRWPRISLVGFSRLHPGALIPAHHDGPKPGVLRFHLGLQHGVDSCVVFEDGDISLKPGEVCVIDQSLQHGSKNEGSVPRDLFVLDYKLDAAEVEAVEAVRGRVHRGMG